MPNPETPVAVVGAGSIGVSWAVVFARSGVPVRLVEADPVRRGEALADLGRRVDDLADAGLIDDSPAEVVGRVSMTDAIEDAVRGAIFVQECVPEILDLKRRIFRELDAAAGPEAVLASSSSAIMASAFASDLEGRHRCLVVHPGNPPYLLPVAEVVPAPFTSEETVEATERLLRSVGMSPVRVQREIEGFVFNRLQGALLREAYCLVRDGVISPEDLDRVVTTGLGRRWSVIGPFATAELNTRGGIEAHAERLGPAYARMGAERGQDDPWTDELVARVAEAVHGRFPPEQWDEGVRQRDRALMNLERARRASDPLMGPFEAPG